MAAEDPTYYKLVVSALEKEIQRTHTNNLEKLMAVLEYYLSTEMMKAVAKRSEKNATKRAGRGGGADGGN